MVLFLEAIREAQNLETAAVADRPDLQIRFALAGITMFAVLTSVMVTITTLFDFEKMRIARVKAMEFA